jgi:glycerol uptake facilitator-like aquaporin
MQCSFTFFACTLGATISTAQGGVSGPAIDILNALVAGLAGSGCISTFSEISGANFNPAVTFGLWVSGKTSNRKFIFYLFAQVLASILAALFCVVYHGGSAKDTIDSLRVIPQARNSTSWEGHLFLGEVIFTFLFNYIVFCNVFENESTQKLTDLNKKELIDSIRASLSQRPDFDDSGPIKFDPEVIQFVTSGGGGSNIPLTLGKAFNLAKHDGFLNLNSICSRQGV